MVSGQNNIDDFSKIHEEELKNIQKRRKLAGLPEGKPGSDSMGLCFSGGGIRSATFNLGILQAMERYGILKHIDYLSTVSGGGYIGSTLTWFMSKLKKPFPFGTSRRDHDGLGGGILAWLRSHGNYLAPGNGLSFWSLFAAILTGIFINLLVLIPVFMLIFRLLHCALPSGISLPDLIPSIFMRSDNPTYYTLTLGAAIVLCALFLFTAIFYALSTRIVDFRNYPFQRWVSKNMGRILAATILCLTIGTMPLVHDFLAAHLGEWIKAIIPSISLVGMLSMLQALRGRKKGKSIMGIRSMLLSVGLALLSYGIFLWFYRATLPSEYSNQYYGLILIISIILAFTADMNHVSMHRFYRNCLMEAYLPYKITQVPVKEADRCYLSDIPQTTAPYQIINTNMQTIGSKDPKLRERGGDNFIFSPLYCGAQSTGYIKTKKYIEGKMNLATVFAISGAAVDTNMYMTRSRPVTFLMTLLNVRLGYWIRNPMHNRGLNRFFPHPTWYYMFVEMFGRGLNEKRCNVHLSDGGHFENLGLYELIRRKCRYIIISDATADVSYSFKDLGKVIEMVRVDFGARIKIDTRPIEPHGKDEFSSTSFVAGAITYNDGSRADLIYVKAAIVKDLPEDIYVYHSSHQVFPNESTTDQFFEEQQFEAYRELGFQIGRQLCGDGKYSDLPGLVGFLKT